MIFWHRKNCAPIVQVKYSGSFVGRRKAGVGVLHPVVVQTAASMFPGHMQLFLHVCRVLDRDSWRWVTLVIITALAKDVLSPHHCSSGFGCNTSQRLGSKSIVSHFRVICALIKPWVKNSLRITYIYMALSLLDLKALYSNMIEVLD